MPKVTFTIERTIQPEKFEAVHIRVGLELEVPDSTREAIETAYKRARGFCTQKADEEVARWQQ